MERVGLIYREKIVEQIKEKFSVSSACLFISFNKLGASAFNTLRNELRRLNTTIFVSKNSLIKRALEDLKKNEFNEFIRGCTGLVFICNEDVVKACKALVEFSKESEGALVLRGGYLKDKRIDKDVILELAKLPSKDVLLSMAVWALTSPLGGFVNLLNQIILRFLWLVEEVKKKKEQ
jgi:large subunit ribosomal protein L10